MNQAELQKLVEEISLRYFYAPFKHEVKINNRMTTTGGRYFLKDHHIDINGHFLDKKYNYSTNLLNTSNNNCFI